MSETSLFRKINPSLRNCYPFLRHSPRKFCALIQIGFIYLGDGSWWCIGGLSSVADDNHEGRISRRGLTATDFKMMRPMVIFFAAFRLAWCCVKGYFSCPKCCIAVATCQKHSRSCMIETSIYASICNDNGEMAEWLKAMVC
jgi:hypothetical protein